MAPDNRFTIEIVRAFSEEALHNILTAYRKGMPWQYSDADEYFREMLLDKECVHIILRNGVTPSGYLLAKPQLAAARDIELMDADPQFVPDPDRYYVETMEIDPEIRNSLSGGKLFFQMLQAMIDEVDRRFGINKFSMHVRVGNGASASVQRYFIGMIIPIRRIKAWHFYNGKDAADYLEGTYSENSGNGSRTLRRLRGRATDQAPNMYTPLEEAKEEIWRRWNNSDLRSEVNSYVNGVPAIFTKEPLSVLCKHIITPNMEYNQFLAQVKDINLKPLGWEFLEDRFSFRNTDKVALAKMQFHLNGNGKQSCAVRTSCIKIVNMAEVDKKMLCAINTLSGQRLDEFHHRILTMASPIELFDASPWYRARGEKAKEYYKYFLSLFLCHGILFENFITNEKEEERFSRIVVMPAYREVVNRFEVKPLIVQLLPPDKAADNYWRSYPEELMGEVEKCLMQSPAQKQCL